MPITDWEPSVKDVGSWVRARTKDVNGKELGTFTVDTRPTDDQVKTLIVNTMDDLSSMIGTDIDQKFWSRAEAIAALGSAMAVELSYFPEQVATGRSPYNQLKELYDERLARLTASMQASGTDVPNTTGAQSPFASSGTGLGPAQPSPFANPFVGPVPAVDWADRW